MVTITSYREDEWEGPTPIITFLGMELDTKMEIWLSDDKLGHLQWLLSEWECQKAGNKGELLPLIGSLQHVSKQTVKDIHSCAG